jgi:lipopolysaccharide/colanic/teichoic acid biosynthesis glycosyltransferase
MAKRYADILVSALGLACLWHLLLILGLLLKLEAPGPVLFRQTRVGYQGRPFTLYKLRTMKVLSPGPPPVVEDFRTYMFSPPLQRDPRVTPIGHALRVTTADELPQLLNVLKGDMSLVGPRPEIPELVKQYPPTYHKRHRVKPGMTCIAAIRGRSDLTYHQSMLYDLEYIKKRSFLHDAKIVARTLLTVARREGAR